MIRRHAFRDGRLVPTDAAPALWIDLDGPDDAERAAVEAETGLRLPDLDEIEEIEISSRLYHEDGADYVTVLLPASNDGETKVGPVSFIATPERLVTIRHHAPRPFETYPGHAARTAYGCATAPAVLLGLMEEVIDRLADILERISRDLDGLSRRLFRAGGAIMEGATLRDLLAALGRQGDLVGDIRLCLVSMDRALAYLSAVFGTRRPAADLRQALKVETRDIRSLSEHCDFLSGKVSHMLDATLGLVANEQNQVIKILSVAAVAFLPPTLIASIYGMNFAQMPELSQGWGYPAALGAMLVSAALPLVYFRRRGWL